MSNVTRINTISTTTLQRHAFKLRLDGLSLEQAGDTLGVPTAVLTGHLIAALKRIPSIIDEEKWAIRTLEMQRLDQLQLSLFPDAKAGNSDAIKEILTIIELREMMRLLAELELALGTRDPL